MISLPEALEACPEDHEPAREQEAWLLEDGSPWVLQCVLKNTVVLRHPVVTTDRRVVRKENVLVEGLRWVREGEQDLVRKMAGRRGRAHSRGRPRAS